MHRNHQLAKLLPTGNSGAAPCELQVEYVQVDITQLSALVRQNVDESVKATLAGLEAIPPDAKAAAMARLAGRVRGFYWVSEFAAVIGRHHQYVSDRCTARVIRTLKGGKPYRIPLSEEDVWNRLAA
jgi:hypothetical protein